MKKKKSVGKIVGISLAAILLISAAGAAIALATREKTYTAEAEAYKDLAMFDHWENADGDVVSKENPYTYKGDELKLTPVYSDLNVKVETGSVTYSPSSKILQSQLWTDVAYVTRPVKKGTTVTFTAQTETTEIFGLSTLDRITNHNEYNWGTGFKIYCPEYNLYYSTSEKAPITLLPSQTSNMGGKRTYSTWTISPSEEHEFRFEFGETVKIFVDGIAFEDPAFSAWQIDYEAGYYFTFAGGKATFAFTEWDLTKNVKAVMTGEYFGKSAYQDKKITFLGDSITAGVGSGDNFADKKYSTVLSTALGATENNMGISGTVLCTGHESRASRLNDVAKIPLDSEAVVIMLGTNDFDQAKAGFAELGKMGDLDTKTIYGAMDALCKSLKERFSETNTRIYLFTPIGRKSEDAESVKCANGYTLRDLSKAYLEVCKKYEIPCFDLNLESGLTDSDFANTLHPNEAGSIKIASYMQSKLVAKWTYRK